ncbi:MAG: nucleotidyltransferase family protein [Deltaproteobacteria bacterium]|nr:nucleotidyltransferase family protein [Deltaproteobacteria bacterium]
MSITTVILCGGKGRRLRPLTEECPKPLVPLNGEPCLGHILRSYIRRGFNRFVLCTGYRGDAVVRYVEGERFDARIAFSDAGEEAGILARLHHAKAQVADERFFVAYGDTLIQVDLSRMLGEHLAHRATVTATTAEVQSPFGLVETDPDGWFTAFREKPRQPYYVGHLLMERALLDELSPELVAMRDGAGLVTLFWQLIRAKRLRSFPYTGPQITFNTEQERDHAEKSLEAYYTYCERGGA